jgi:hypothetical protein
MYLGYDGRLLSWSRLRIDILLRAALIPMRQGRFDSDSIEAASPERSTV